MNTEIEPEIGLNENKEEKSEDTAESDTRDGYNASLHSAYAAYYDILTDAVDKWGINRGYESDTQGVHYAQLLDFDGDGISELLFIHTEQSDHADFLTIYGYTDKIVLYYADEMYNIGDFFEGWNISENANGEKYIYSWSDSGPVMGPYLISEQYFTVKNGEWVNVFNGRYVSAIANADEFYEFSNPSFLDNLIWEETYYIADEWDEREKKYFLAGTLVQEETYKELKAALNIVNVDDIPSYEADISIETVYAAIAELERRLGM
jgi:hypothetical protein